MMRTAESLLFSFMAVGTFVISTGFMVCAFWPGRYPSVDLVWEGPARMAFFVGAAHFAWLTTQISHELGKKD